MAKTAQERAAEAGQKAQDATAKARDLEADQPEKDRRAAARDPDNAAAIEDREDAKRHRQAVRELEKQIPDGTGFSSDNPGARTQEEAERDRGMRP
jgi:hypothetical protein